MKTNEIAAFRFEFEKYTVIFGLRDFSRESASVSQRFAGCADVTNCKQVIVHIFKNTEHIAALAFGSLAFIFRIFKK